MTHQLLNRVIAWSVFAIALITYCLTLEPTNSWWDCGEYISTAYKLQVGHPPGAPLFLLIATYSLSLPLGMLKKLLLWLILCQHCVVQLQCYFCFGLSEWLL